MSNFNQYLQQIRFNLIIMLKKNKIKQLYKPNRLLTQNTATHQQHLEYHKKHHLEILESSYVLSTPQRKSSRMVLPQTNFGTKITNSYLYVLLHLRTKQTQNNLSINIPEICIFIGGKPYEVIYSRNGIIYGCKDHETNRINYQQVRKIFKMSWKSNSDNAQGLACFRSEQKNYSQKSKDQYVIVSKSELSQILYKFIEDPYFKNLQYLQNLLPNWGHTIKIDFDHEKNQDLKILAERDLENYKNQIEEKRQLDEQQYLLYCCSKIYLYLRFEQNIILKKGSFLFAKIGKVEQYPLINIENLEIVNMTNEIKLKQKNDIQQRKRTQQVLAISLSEIKQYIPKCNPSSVKTLQGLMNSSYQNIINRINFKTVDQSKRQEFKNELAFKKLHPRSKITYSDLIRGNNFKRLTNKLFKSNERKPLSSPPKFVLKTYYQKHKHTKSQMLHSSAILL